MAATNLHRNLTIIKILITLDIITELLWIFPNLNPLLN